MVKSSNLTLSFSAESSIEEELKRESTADVITILVRDWKKGFPFNFAISVLCVYELIDMVVLTKARFCAYL